MKAQPWLCFAGVEVGNANRTLTYVRKGLLEDSRVTVTLRSPMLPEGFGYDDIYGDTYLADPYWPGNLLCYCPGFDESPYLSPDADPAPWYEPARAESAEFLGIWLTSLEVDAVASRAVTPSSFGGHLGPLGLKHRILAAEGLMFASTQAGMAYGERWLQDVLSGSYCTSDGCAADEAVILPACPDTGVEPDRFWRTIKRAGVVSGPTFTPEGSFPDCVAQKVEFQVAAGIPYLHADADTVVEGTATHLGADVCGLVSTDEWVGDTATIITLSNAAGNAAATGIVVRATPAPNGDCPTELDNPCVRYTIPELTGGDQIVIDSTTREVRWYDATRKRWLGGLHLLRFSGLMGWVDVPPCSDMCICVTVAGGNVGVTVESVAREL